jgi:hypothetical protein
MLLGGTHREICLVAADMKLLEAMCQLTPAADNPYMDHPLPLQFAWQMENQGRLRSASLAYEAAARVSILEHPCSLDAFIMSLTILNGGHDFDDRACWPS